MIYKCLRLLVCIFVFTGGASAQCPWNTATTITSATTSINSNGGVRVSEKVIVGQNMTVSNNVNFYISGTLEINGSVSTEKSSSINVCSNGLLVIRGDLYLGNQASINVRSGGTLIILGKVDGQQGNISLDNDGKIVLAGTVTLNKNNSMSGSSGVSYIFDPTFTPNVGSGGVVGDFDELIKSDPSLLDLFTQYSCPTANVFSLATSISGANIILTSPEGYTTYDYYAKMPGTPETVVQLSASGNTSSTISVPLATYLSAKQFIVYAKKGACYQAATAACITPQSSLLLSTPSVVCNGTMVRIDVLGAPVGSKYSYYMDGNSYIYQSTASSSTRNDISIGNHTFKVDVISPSGCNVTTPPVIYNSNGITGPSCSCGGSAPYQSVDGRVGLWSDPNTWFVPDAISPKVPVGMSNQTVYIKGTVTYDGNLSISNGSHYIVDTLIVKGNLSVSSYSLKLCSSGVLIVLGNYNGNIGGGSTDLQGRVVVDGLINNSYSNTINISNGGHLYGVGGSTSLNGINGATQTKNDLMNNDPSLYDTYMQLKCGGSGVTGGAIASIVPNYSCFSGSTIAISNASNATPVGATYSWQASVDKGSTWFVYPGSSATNSITTLDLLVNGILTKATSLQLRRVASSGSCSALSNILMFYRIPHTGPPFHVGNNIAK